MRVIILLIYIGKGIEFCLSLCGKVVLLFLAPFKKCLIFLARPTSIFVKIKYFTIGVTCGVIFISIYQGYIFVNALPHPKLIGTVNFPVSTRILDRNGRLLYEIYHDQNRTPITLSSLPPYIKNATIAIEDKDFYRHQGVSLIGGMIRAIKDMILKKRLQGGSTITQQLVKSALLTPERTIQRKVKEIILALWTEKIFTKDQILEMYLNQVPYGGSSYGIEQAAKTYFNKSAQHLTLPEASFLAGLPQAPTLYSPYVNPEGAIFRRNDVALKMKEIGLITQKQYDEIIGTRLIVAPIKTYIKAPHFVFYVRSLLEEMYGNRFVEEGGLTVTTTLDFSLQEKVEDILQSELDEIKHLSVENGGVLVTIPSRGEIIAMAGSKDYFTAPGGAFNVTTAHRQPGSMMKPVMYSLALEKGVYSAASILEDTPIVFSILGSRPYSPVNYDGRFHGRIPLRYALANSYNVPAVKVLATIGMPAFIAHAQKMGITTWDSPKRYGLSLVLGGGEIKMTDAAVAFGVFANKGEKVDINPFLKIEDYHGSTLLKQKVKKERVLSEGVSFIISDILSDNYARSFAFGIRSALEVKGVKVAVKTGTTDDKRDNWTTGYTPRFLTSVWVGNNNNTPMHPYLTSGITGAAPIWNKVMSELLSDGAVSRYNVSPIKKEFTEPEGIVKQDCYNGRVEYFIEGTEGAQCKGTWYKLTPTPVIY